MIRLIRAALFFVRSIGWIPSPAWTQDDYHALKLFLGSPTGKRLIAYLQNYACREAIIATQTTQEITFRCGYASGFRSLIAVIQTLSASGPQPEQSEEGQSQDAANLDHLQP